MPLAGQSPILTAETIRESILVERARTVAGEIGELAEFFVCAAANPVTAGAGDCDTQLPLGGLRVPQRDQRCAIGSMPACVFTGGARPAVM